MRHSTYEFHENEIPRPTWIKLLVSNQIPVTINIGSFQFDAVSVSGAVSIQIYKFFDF